MLLFKLLLYYGIIIPLSLLPFPILYSISDVLYIVLYYVFGYRKKVVRINLTNSFPNKSLEEIKKIEKKFYHHFCDIIVEAIKGFTISEKELKKRIKCSNIDILDQYYNEKRNVMLVTGHYGNWEMSALAMAIYCKHKAMGVFHPLKDKFFNKKLKESRGRFGLNLVAPNQIGKFLTENKVVVSGFVADQTPHNVYRCYWTNFLNQETPVYYGTENFAVNFDQPVFFVRMDKIKRGYYNTEIIPVSVEPTKEKPNFITEKHTRILEKLIIEQPEYWLWTHRRWKRKKPVDYVPVK